MKRSQRCQRSDARRGMNTRNAHAADLVHLRRPDVAAATGRRIRPDDSRRRSLEAGNGSGPCDLDIRLGRRRQVIVPVVIYHEGIRAIRVLQRVREADIAVGESRQDTTAVNQKPAKNIAATSYVRRS